MPFVKVQKNKAYFKRFQVKFRRRRQGKTDYRARRKLTTQDKNKYNSPKYRLCVRFSNRYVTAQVIKATIKGDITICHASSQELEKHGLTVGLKNYSASYCTGLLVARRLLSDLGLDSIYRGSSEVTGEAIACVHEDTGKTYYVEELDGVKKPFRALLDVGIKATTTGAKVFAVMKGASDGGLDVPHNHKRFPGFDRDTKEFDAEVHKSRIMGEHVADYMREMQEDDEEMYKKHFKEYLDADLEADDLEEMYEKVHSSIREDPSRAAKTQFDFTKQWQRPRKIGLAARKAKIAEKKVALQASL